LAYAACKKAGSAVKEITDYSNYNKDIFYKKVLLDGEDK
jgi:hypothetical protein